MKYRDEVERGRMERSCDWLLWEEQAPGRLSKRVDESLACPLYGVDENVCGVKWCTASSKFATFCGKNPEVDGVGG